MWHQMIQILKLDKNFKITKFCDEIDEMGRLSLVNFDF